MPEHFRNACGFMALLLWMPNLMGFVPTPFIGVLRGCSSLTAICLVLWVRLCKITPSPHAMSNNLYCIKQVCSILLGILVSAGLVVLCDLVIQQGAHNQQYRHMMEICNDLFLKAERDPLVENWMKTEWYELERKAHLLSAAQSVIEHWQALLIGGYIGSFFIRLQQKLMGKIEVDPS